jgi:hypothetical protein
MSTNQPGKEASNPQSKPRQSRARGAKSVTAKETSSTDLQTAKAVSDRTATVRTLLKDLGLREDGVAKLESDTVVKLGGLLATEGQRSNLIGAMFNAVADTTPKKLARLVNIMESYSGSPTILETFLTQLGQHNPFLAAEKAQILVLPANDTGTARGASGHVLTGVTYCAYDRDMPTNTTGYLSGKQAITKIFEAFSPDRVTDAAKERVRNRRSSELRKALRDVDLETISLDDLETHPELKDELRSQLLTRNLAVYEELRKAIEQCKSNLSSMVYGGDVLLPGINSLKVGQDPGRQFFGWFEEHFKENPNAPQGIKLAYASISDPDVSLSEAEEAHYVRGLLAYQRVHSFINKGTALAGLVSDLNEYERLALEDPLRMDSKIELARQSLQATISSTPTELSIAEFSSVLESAAMVEFRQEMNRRVLSLYKDEFERALKLFDFVSFEKGMWRQDALGDSVPMERLRQHLYGAKIGVASRWDGPEKKRAVLGQADFRHIMDAQFLQRLITGEEKLLNAKPIAEFRAMVEGVVVAYRKAMFLESQLAQYATTPDGASAIATLHREQVGEVLCAWKPALPIGGGFRPAEVWFDSTKEPKPKLRSIGEIADRMRDRKSHFFPDRPLEKHRLRDQYNKFLTEIEQFAEAGLYRPEMDELWREIAAKVADLMPASARQEIVDRAARVLVNPMVVGGGYFTPERLAKRYLLSGEVTSLEQLAGLESQLAEACAGYNQAQLGELRARAGRRIDGSLFVGAVGKYNNGYGRLTLEQRSFAEFAGAMKPTAEPSSVQFFNPKRLAEALDTLEESYISTEELGRDWIERARKLCSKSGKSALDAKGFALVDTATFRTAQSLMKWHTYYVSREFADAVNQLMPSES